MKAILESIFWFVLLFWLCGGGFFIGLLCFVWTWKLAIATWCLWGCSWVITCISIMCENVLKGGDGK